MLAPLHRAFEVREAVAVLASRAADYGEAAVDELRRQVINLLGLAEPPVERLGRRLAFDVLDGTALRGAAEVDRRVARDVARLLGWPEARLALRRIVVPVFHGVGLQLRLRLSGAATREALVEALRRDGVATGGAGAPTTPSEAAEGGTLAAVEITEDGLGGFWLWVVADDPGPRAATAAVELAARQVAL